MTIKEVMSLIRLGSILGPNLKISFAG
jgi:hypothetical protein